LQKTGSYCIISVQLHTSKVVYLCPGLCHLDRKKSEVRAVCCLSGPPTVGEEVGRDTQDNKKNTAQIVSTTDPFGGLDSREATLTMSRTSSSFFCVKKLPKDEDQDRQATALDHTVLHGPAKSRTHSRGGASGAGSPRDARFLTRAKSRSGGAGRPLPRILAIRLARLHRCNAGAFNHGRIFMIWTITSIP